MRLTKTQMDIINAIERVRFGTDINFTINTAKCVLVLSVHVVHGFEYISTVY